VVTIRISFWETVHVPIAFSFHSVTATNFFQASGNIENLFVPPKLEISHFESGK
jgi:hypothetical protein